MMKKRKNKNSNLRLHLGILTILLILAIIALIAVKLFVVEKVEVEGNELYDSKVIEETVLSDAYSWNSLYVLGKYRFFQKSGQVPFIDTLEISLKNPHTLHVKVYEKGMMGYVYIEELEQNAYFDKDGFVVELSSDIIEGVPKITGVTCEEVELLKKLPIDGNLLKNMLVLTQKLKGENLIPDSIAYGQKESPVLYYNQVRIQLGDISNLTQKVNRIVKIYPSIKNESGILHLEKWTEETPNIVFDKDK